MEFLYMKEQHAKRPTCQKLAFQGKLSLSEILAQICSNDSLQILLNLTQSITLGTYRVKFRRIFMKSSAKNGT